MELTALDVLHNAPTGLTLEQVQSGQAGTFIAKNSLQISHPHWGRDIWLRMTLSANTTSAVQPLPAVLMLPTPYLDKVQLYIPSTHPAAPWMMQQAGDFFEPHTWAMRSFHPKFNLPTPSDATWRGSKELVIYIHIAHIAPVMLNLEIADAKQASERDLLNLVIYSLGLGAILLSALLTAAMALLHRDSIYAWYSAYALCAALACASHSGLAQNLLWPVGGYWPGTAVLSFVLLCGLCQMQFSLALNAERTVKHPMRYGVYALCAACILLAIGFPIYTPYWRTFYFISLAVLGSAMALSVWLMIMGWRSGHRLAGAWLLAFIPLFSTVGLALLEGIGLLPSSYWSYSMAIYAAILEVLILGMALQWFARERHGERERMKILASTDPLTGFAAASSFRNQLVHDWRNAEKHKHDLAVVYIELRTQANSKEHMERLLARSVRILRAATGAQDMVARLDGTLMALLMPKMSLGDDLNQRLSRIVALGLMPDRNDLEAHILQFRIAATTRATFKENATQLDEQLRELLSQPKGWGSKPIRFVGDTLNRPSTANSSYLPDLDDIWRKAYKQQLQDSSTSTKR